MIKKWKLTIPTLSGNTPRRAYVYVPNEAKRHPERRYPVLYMFDGHNVFYDSDATYGKSWGMKAYMDRTRTPVIIAAVECNHGANGERLSEYSPYSFYAPGSVGKGHGADYYIADPDKACVASAQLQLQMLALLLKDDAARAKEILANFKPRFASKEEYFAFIEAFSRKGDCIEYIDGKAIAAL